MQVNKIVLDTTAYWLYFREGGTVFPVWQALHGGKYILCVSNDILEEYEEIIGNKTNPVITSNVVQMLINSPFVEFVDTYFHFHLIEQDKDDNKFVDCAIAANAQYIVSEDAHFKHLKNVPFPYVRVIRLKDFMTFLGDSTSGLS